MGGYLVNLVIWNLVKTRACKDIRRVKIQDIERYKAGKAKRHLKIQDS